MANFLNDEDELEKAAADAQNRKAFLGAAGGVTDALTNVRSAAEIALGQGRPQNRFGDSFRAAAESVENPMDTKSKALAYIKAKRDRDLAAKSDDASSPDSLAMAEQVGGMFPQFAKYVQGKSKAQIQEMMPILAQKARGDEDRALREQEMRMRHEDRVDARMDRAENKALKQKELSTTQAKQRGLYEIGSKAEEQFQKAVADKSEYDPTGVGQWIDNSDWAPNVLKNDKAVEARAAQDSWIESFLRDASGAAIPDSERASYRKIYFPQPGDPDDVVANKAQLRAQKSESARIAAGVETGHGPAVSTAPSSKTPQQLAQEALERRRANKKKVAGK